MKIGIYAGYTHTDVLRKLEELLTNSGIDSVYVDELLSKKADFDVLMVIGGDGTILRVVEYAVKNNLCVLGLNAGNLGFLTEFESDELEKAVAALINGELVTEERTVLSIKIGRKAYLALNDITVQRINDNDSYSKVVKAEAYIDDKYVDTFFSDGVIVSTPTGSTAYSLSAGGAILSPDTAAFSLTPICAHSLRNRPIVYKDTSVCSVAILNGSCRVGIQADGRFIGEIKKQSKISIKKHDVKFKLMKKKDSNFYETMQRKLNKWGKN